ncbi:Uncharacterized protein APZ42_001004, partial [Daphnia magna]
ETWLTGPKWLLKKSEWPVWEKNSEPTAVFHLSIITSAAVLQSSSSPISEKGIKSILDISRSKDKSRESWKVGPVTVTELRAAERKWLLAIQEQYFSSELKYFPKQAEKRPALVSQLDLFVGNDGLLRCSGRLKHSCLKEDTKHPMLLPKESSLTTLIIMAHHILAMHGGVRLTVAS